MNTRRYLWILYLITAVIIATISIQVYWNFKNYQNNKQRLINDVQHILDKAVDDYYANLAEETTIGMSFEGTSSKELFEKGSSFTNILKDIDKKNGKFKSLDSIDVSHIEGATIVRGNKVDSMMTEYSSRQKPVTADSLTTKTKKLKGLKNNLSLSNIEMLTSKIVISINNDTLDVKKVDSLVNLELQRKDITIDYNLKYSIKKQNFPKSEVDKIKTDDKLDTTKTLPLKATSKSTFLPKGSKLSIAFTNETKVILKRIIGGILLSTLLVIAVISCLYYLLKVIKKQKQLAEVKNDLISNITHEFKTPIATIGVEPEMIERTISAWYTPQISVSNGPAKYQGLPGLILEVHDGKLTIICSKIVLNPEERIEIEIPAKGKQVSQDEYNAIMKKKTEEMMERYAPRKGRKGEGIEIIIGG